MLLPCRHYLSYTSSVDTPKQRRGEANPEQIPQTEGQTLESDDQDVVVMLNKDLRTTPAIMESVVTLEAHSTTHNRICHHHHDDTFCVRAHVPIDVIKTIHQPNITQANSIN